MALPKTTIIISSLCRWLLNGSRSTTGMKKQKALICFLMLYKVISKMSLLHLWIQCVLSCFLLISITIDDSTVGKICLKCLILIGSFFPLFRGAFLSCNKKIWLEFSWVFSLRNWADFALVWKVETCEIRVLFIKSRHERFQNNGIPHGTSCL